MKIFKEIYFTLKDALGQIYSGTEGIFICSLLSFVGSVEGVYKLASKSESLVSKIFHLMLLFFAANLIGVIIFKKKVIYEEEKSKKTKTTEKTKSFSLHALVLLTKRQLS